MSERRTAETALNPFIINWNREHEDIVFAIGTVTPLGPAEVKVRFDARKYMEARAVSFWNGLEQQLGMRSKNCVLLGSEGRAVRLGVIDLDIACASSDYDEARVVQTLKWLGEEFIPNGLQDER